MNKNLHWKAMINLLSYVIIQRILSMIVILQTGKGFHFSALSYTHKELGWLGDAKKWCGVHSINKPQITLVSFKEWFKVSFTQVLLKDQMIITKSVWVHGPSKRSYLSASTKPCIFPTKCFKLLRILRMKKEMKMLKPSKSKESFPVQSTSKPLSKKDMASNPAKKFYSRLEWTLNTKRETIGKTIENLKTNQVCF